ncbi:MAG: hypothetical protein IT380_14895 [Myxococcales bacterium]|nr:hypothetical protein [Myxococcales bacterium]
MKRLLVLLALATGLGCALYQTRHVTRKEPPPAAWEDVTPDAGSGW